MSFKVGDRVICINNRYLDSDFMLTEGREYIIEAPGWASEFVFVRDDVGDVTPYSATRFVPVYDSKTPVNSKTTLPTDSTDRKNYPLYSGCLRYFPAALAGVAKTSKLGNDKHNPGEEMHHARGKSMDHGDCILRHLIDVEDLVAALSRGDANVTPNDVLLEVNQMAWRVLAFSQDLHEKFGAPLAPGARK